MNTTSARVAKHGRVYSLVERYRGTVETNSKYSIDTYMGGHVEGAKNDTKWVIAG